MAAGGVNGKQLELNFQDSQGDPESAVSAYGKLMDWGMDVSLGCVMSGETASVVAAAKEDDVLLLTPSGSSDSCLSGNDKAFRICFYDSYQGTAAANYLSEKNLATEVGVLYQSDSDYSTGLYAPSSPSALISASTSSRPRPSPPPPAPTSPLRSTHLSIPASRSCSSPSTLKKLPPS